MKWRIIKISNLILALLLVAFTIGYTYAWFADYYSIDIKLYVSPDGGYFAGGSGTVSDPYIITRPTHLYNLAWLQNSGKFSSTEATYFQIGDDDNKITEIDMDGYVIPPIGNDANPFIGVFDGNGCTISNLIVSTDKTKLTNFPVESATGYEFSSYVGLFGKTDGSSNIKNFILSNPIVEVASEKTKYSDTTSESYCGLAIGYVAYKASSIGVIGGTLAVKKEGYSTYNSILGSISDDVDISVTGGSVDSDTGYFIPDLINANISNVGTTNSYIHTGSDDYLYTFTAKSWITSVKGLKDDNDNDLLTSNFLNLGVFSFITSDGRNEDVAIRSTKTEISSDTKIYIGSYTTDSSYGYTIGQKSTDYFTLGGNDTDEIKDTKYRTSVVKPSGEQYTELNYTFYMKNSPSSMTGTSYSVISENNSTLESSATYNIYENCILVNITDSQNAHLIMIVMSNNSDGNVAVSKVVDKVESTFNFATGYKRFATSYTDNDALSMSNPKKNNSYDQYYHYADEPVYYEIDLTDGAGIYSINTGQNGFHIYYLAVTGVDGDGSADDEYDVSSIDFIYSGVSITQSEITSVKDGTNISQYSFIYNGELYTPTGTMIAFDAVDTTGAIIILAFSRPDGGTDTSNCTISVSYYVDGYGTPTSSVSGKGSLTHYTTYAENEDYTYDLSGSG